MMKAEQRPSKAWQRKCVARWRLLSARGLDRTCSPYTVVT